ncbi:MAG: glycosyltransferase [Gemmatimonadaceae bacterium]
MIEAKRPIFFLAPFSPIGSSDVPFLGGANKISALVRVLARSGRQIWLVNSAHNRQEFRRGRVGRLSLGARRPIIHVEPFTVRLRPVGKFLNLFSVRELAKRLARENPFLVWLYNGYAFDALLASELHERTGCKVVLEIEDLHTARSRGLNPKPLIDDWYLRRRVLPITSLAACVNEEVCKLIRSSGLPTVLLPGILAPELSDTPENTPPFSKPPYTLGYFGGLYSEKGVEVLLKLCEELPNDWRMVITGVGPLANACARIARSNSRLSFFHALPQEQVIGLMTKCDVIANPHKPIAAMKNGIFPFKVFEALAAARVLISTPLPQSGVNLGAVMWFDGSAKDLKRRLCEARDFYFHQRLLIERTADWIRERFSENGVSDTLNDLIPSLDSGS